jgi:hypothetical protein
MPKFIIDQAIALRTIVEVEAGSYEEFVEKYKAGDYEDEICEEQMQWNVEDQTAETFDGSYNEYQNSILSLTKANLSRGLSFEHWSDEYKREYLKQKIQ